MGCKGLLLMLRILTQVELIHVVPNRNQKKRMINVLKHNFSVVVEIILSANVIKGSEKLLNRTDKYLLL